MRALPKLFCATSLYTYKPLKEKYRQDASASRVTLRAQGSQESTPLPCSIDIGRAIYQSQAHQRVGGAGTAARSGDLLLGAGGVCPDHLPDGGCGDGGAC